MPCWCHQLSWCLVIVWKRTKCCNAWQNLVTLFVSLFCLIHLSQYLVVLQMYLSIHVWSFLHIILHIYIYLYIYAYPYLIFTSTSSILLLESPTSPPNIWDPSIFLALRCFFSTRNPQTRKTHPVTWVLAMILLDEILHHLGCIKHL